MLMTPCFMLFVMTMLLLCKPGCRHGGGGGCMLPYLSRYGFIIIVVIIIIPESKSFIGMVVTSSHTTTY